MKRRIDQGVFFGLVVAIIALTLTAIPVLLGGHLGGTLLLAHMMTSGVLVFLLPVFALMHLPRIIDPATSTLIHRAGFWSLVLSGLITLATMLLCMLPVSSTDQMRELVRLHGYAGFAMVPALIVLMSGIWHRRRIQATRSSTPG